LICRLSVVWKFDILDSSLVVFKVLGKTKNRNKPLWYDGQIYFHWYKILGLLYKRALFDLQYSFLSSSLPICNFKAILHIICTDLIHSQSCLHVNTGWIHTCDLIGRLFLGNLLTPVYYQELKVALRAEFIRAIWLVGYF
jgi:hypothetical protein